MGTEFILFKSQKLYFHWIHVETNTSSCRFQTMHQISACAGVFARSAKSFYKFYRISFASCLFVCETIFFQTQTHTHTHTHTSCHKIREKLIMSKCLWFSFERPSKHYQFLARTQFGFSGMCECVVGIVELGWRGIWGIVYISRPLPEKGVTHNDPNEHGCKAVKDNVSDGWGSGMGWTQIQDTHLLNWASRDNLDPHPCQQLVVTSQTGSPHRIQGHIHRRTHTHTHIYIYIYKYTG